MNMRLSTPHAFLTALSLALSASMLCAWLLASPFLADPDSFYHIGVSRLMQHTGRLTIDFDALPLTTLATTFADQAWLYHLLLIPFVTLLGDAWAIKVFAVVNAAALTTALFFIARRWRAPLPWCYPLALLLTAPFVFRLALGKPSALAVLIFIGGVYAGIEKKYWRLGFLTAAFTLAHGAWPLLVACSLWSSLMHKDMRTSLSSLGGAAAGLLMNPYFPINLAFFWQQSVLIGLKGFRETVGVGSEWYPYPLADFLADNALVLALTMVALFIAIMCRDRMPRTHALLWPCLALLILTLRANRNIEFLAPLLALFSVSTVSLRASSLATLSSFFLRQRRSPYLLMTGAAAALFLVSAARVIALKPVLARGYRADAFAAPSLWLTEHVPPDTLVVNTRWEDFPALWMRNPQLRFVIGLDPAFLYLASEDRYRSWLALVNGQTDISPSTVHAMFGGDTVLVKKEKAVLYQTLARSPLWTAPFEDDIVAVFQPARVPSP